MKNNTRSFTHHQANDSHNVFDNPELFIEKFDGLERDEWQKPHEVIKAFDLSSDATVVEIGAGTGYFAVRLAEHLKDGSIFVYEQAPKMADYLKSRVNKLGLSNVAVRMTEPDGSLVLEKPADLMFSVDVYHHIQDRVAYFTKAREHLKTKGVLVVIDRTEEKVEGQPTGHRIPVATVKEEMQEAGFVLVQELDFLQPVQYYMAFKKVE